ncbi:MAG: ABC transporter substrate-binding protein [Chloroflexota bacterium]
MAGGDPNGYPLRICYAALGVSDLLFYVGLDAGFFRQQHLKVNMILAAANVSLPALANGDLEFNDSASNAIEGASRGLPLKLLFSGWQESPWTLVGKTQYKSLPDLKGKVIGTTGAGATPYMYVQAALKQAGMAPGDVQIVSSTGTAVTYASILSGKVEAGVLSPPFDLMAEEKGFHEVMYLGKVLRLPYVGLVVNTKFLAAHRPETVATLKALVDASGWVKAHPSEATGLLVKYTGSSPDIAKKTMDKMLSLLNDSGQATTESIQQGLDIQAAVTHTPSTLTPDQVVDYGPLREALAKGSVTG